MTTETLTRHAPAGYYALVNNQDNETYFFRIDAPTEGKWAGYRFVKAVHGDNATPVKDRLARTQILRAIDSNPVEACARYGHETGVCGKCHRTLTDPESVAQGIGPVCLKSF